MEKISADLIPPQIDSLMQSAFAFQTTLHCADYQWQVRVEIFQQRDCPRHEHTSSQKLFDSSVHALKYEEDDQLAHPSMMKARRLDIKRSSFPQNSNLSE